MIRFLAIIRTAGRYGERLVTHNATFLLLAQLRQWFYQKLEPLAPAGLQSYRSSDLLSRLQSDIEQLDNFYLSILLPSIVALIAVPILFISLHVFYPALALLILSALVIVGLLLPTWVVRKTAASGSIITEQRQQLTTAIIDGLQGMRELEIYGAKDAQLAQVSHYSKQLASSQLQINSINAQSQSTSVLVINTSLWLSLILLGIALSNNTIPQSQFVMLLLLSLAAFEAVQPLPMAFEQLSATLSAARRLFSLADQQPVRVEPKAPASLSAQLAQQPLSIEFKQLNFSYPNQSQQVLHHLSLVVNQGEKIAISGRSGSGKSTIVQLLQGFYPCPEGTINIAGIDINHCSGEELRQQLSVVSQHSYLFAASIRDNLLLANPKATPEQLQQACDIAAASEFIAQLPQGLDTWLGETGRGLSGGQARRIHIAQALLKNAPVLILDEPTQGLDPITEQQVMRAIWQLMKNKTVILITHNPRLLASVDRVYQLGSVKPDWLID